MLRKREAMTVGEEFVGASGYFADYRGKIGRL